MNQENEIKIGAELTPNPNTLKFNVSKQLLERGTRNFPDKEKAQGSPLALELFSLEPVRGIMIGPDFVTVTKAQEAEWYNWVPAVVEKIKAFLQTDQPPVISGGEEAPAPGSKTQLEQNIIDLLDAEIRPAVARDGGDIIFYGFENGVVKLHLQGSCSSCPSSVLTLKMGIENRLKQLFPEVKEVIQV